MSSGWEGDKRLLRLAEQIVLGVKWCSHYVYSGEWQLSLDRQTVNWEFPTAAVWIKWRAGKILVSEDMWLNPNDPFFSSWVIIFMCLLNFYCKVILFLKGLTYCVLFPIQLCDDARETWKASHSIPFHTSPDPPLFFKNCDCVRFFSWRFFD